MDGLVVRRLADSELERAAALWTRTKKAAYPWLEIEQARTAEEDLAWFRRQAGERWELWGALRGDELLGLLALEGAVVDQLYVAPDAQGRGVGSALLAKARERHPDGLSLFTPQRNERARRFYERQGFVPVRFGVRPPPENEPDIKYEWTPSPDPASGQ